jgi:hypothetical protein
MRWLLLALVILGCRGTGAGLATEPEHAASPADAQAFAEKLVAAINACDQPAIESLVNIRALATRAATARGASAAEAKRYADVTAASWGSGPCGEYSRVEVAFVRMNPRGKASRPLLRWSNADTAFGYVELIVSKPPDKPAELFDLVSALEDQTVVTSLANVYVNMPARDQPGMTSDVVHGPFSDGLPQGGRMLLHDMDREEPLVVGGAPPDPRRPARVIARALPSLDYAAILIALDDVEQRVGSDAFLHALRAAAMIGAGHDRLALESAAAAAKLAPGSKDALLALLHAQVGANNLAGAEQTLTTLATSFDFSRNQVRNSPRLRPLAETDAFQRMAN